MPLRPAPLAIQFAGGIETKQDSKQVPTARLIDLQNATFIKQTTLAKRNGYQALGQQVDSTGVNYTEAVGLGARDGELVLFDGANALSFRESSGTWSDAGDVSSVVASDSPIARSGTQQLNADHGSNGGVTVVAWEDSRGGVWANVIEQDTGRVLKAEAQVDSAGVMPRVVACGTVLLLLHVVVSSHRIYVTIINPVTPTAAFAPSILTDDIEVLTATGHGPAYDACTAGGNLYPDIGPGLIAWPRLLTSGGGFRVGYLSPTGVLGSPLTNLPSVATFADPIDGPIAITYDKRNLSCIGLTWGLASHFYVRFLDSATLASIGDFDDALPAACTRCACEFGDKASGLPEMWWAFECSGAVVDQNLVYSGSNTNDGADVQVPRTLLGHGLVTRAFDDNGDVYVGVAHGVKFFPYVALVRLSADTFGGAQGTQTYTRTLPGLSTGLGTKSIVASSPPLSPDEFFLSRQHATTLGYRIQLSSKNGDQFSESGIRLASFDFDHSSSYQTAQLGRGLYLGSACMQHYDGSRWAEAGYNCAPDTATGTMTVVKAGGGSLTASSTYLYVACYEEIDALGELHRGPTSAPQTVALGVGETKVTITIPTLRLTKRKNVRIGVFRSTSNATGTIDQIPFYRVTSTDPTVILGSNVYITNDPTVDIKQLPDVMSDATLLTQEPLYTNGGILSNDPTPSAGGVIAGGKNRLFFTDPSDPNLVRFTQERADETAAELAAPLSIRVDPYGGRIVGIGVLDDAIVVFKETAVHVFGGPGPSAAPALSQDGWTPSQLLTSDVGCKAAGSICQTPIGITFQSSKGIMLLSRDRSVVDIGKAVYAYNDQNIVRATLLPDRHQIIFLTDSGRTLLYDYHPDIQQWSTFTNHEGLDAVVVAGTYHYLRNDGRVFVEAPGVYRDDNQHIPMVIETAWVKLTGYLQGWQSILWAYFLGTYLSPHTLRFRYRIDYNDAYSAPIDMDVNTNYTPSLYGAGLYGAGEYGGPGGSGTRYQRRKHLNKKCQSILFRIEDVEATSDYGASFQLSELLLIGGVLDTKFKPGSARST